MNSIADWLSFEGEERLKHRTGKQVQNSIANDYLPNDFVSDRILSSFPQLVPAGFQISHLPNKVIVVSCQAMQIFELCLIQKQKVVPNLTTESGGGGTASALILLAEKIPCLTEYRQTNLTSSYGPSLKCTESQTSVKT